MKADKNVPKDEIWMVHQSGARGVIKIDPREWDKPWKPHHWAMMPGAWDFYYPDPEERKKMQQKFDDDFNKKLIDRFREIKL